MIGKKWAPIALGAGLALVLSTVTPAHAEESSALEALSSVTASSAGVAEDVLGEVADVAARDSGPAVIDATVNDVDVSIPRDAKDPISLTSPSGETVAIGLPFAGSAGDAEIEADGIVSYDNGNLSTTVPVVKEDGPVQVTTVIDSVSAPTLYDYPLDIPEGGTVSLQDNGAAVILTETGGFAGAIAPAWATDAAGNSVATHYELVGDTLRQVVEHDSLGTAHPVVADPWLGVNLIDKYGWKMPNYPGNNGRGWTLSVAVTPMMALVNEAVASTAGWDELLSRNRGYCPVEAKFPNASYKQQWICHSMGKTVIGVAGWLGIDKRPTWDLESWRPAISPPKAWDGVIKKHCNW